MREFNARSRRDGKSLQLVVGSPGSDTALTLDASRLEHETIIAIAEEGMYRLTGADLAQAGLSLDEVDVNRLNLYYGGGSPLDPEGSPDSRAALEPARLKPPGNRLEFSNPLDHWGLPTSLWPL